MRFLRRCVGTLLLLFTAALLPRSEAQAQQSATRKRVLVLYWYNRDYPGNVTFDRYFQAALASAARDDIEYYSEYLESNRFPGENQSLALRDYLQRKYAGLRIDVLVTTTPAPLDFLLKYRSTLFPTTPVVFGTIDFPPAEQIASGPGATGIVYAKSHRKTIDLALKLQPDTNRVFVITGTREWETAARDELRGYENKVAITYLTGLPLDDLITKVKSLPDRSIIFYVRQQAPNRQGKVLDPPDVLTLLSRSARVPIYGMADTYIGLGIVGGYVWTVDTNAIKLVDIILRIINGAHAADIPVERAPDVPMFDWRQLQRWGIDEARLPPVSVIRFRELTVWQQYKWRIVAAIFLFVLQAFLIGALLVERHRSRRVQRELQGYKGQLEDLVEKRTAELVEARDQAVAANRSKSTFLANMSHELRTPLNAILGFSGIVLNDPDISEQHRKDLVVVENSGEHLLGLIDEVLDMAKIETGGTVVELACCDLHRLVNETVNMLRERARAKNLELVIDISSRSPQFVRSDPGKIRQVLINLLGNAMKYTDDGSVVVRFDGTRAETSSEIMLKFDVEDTGIGIAPEDQVRIFEPFVQAGNGARRQGTGLGLSITRHFVHLLGGRIEVQSTSGRGSRFHVEIPAQAAEQSEITAGAAELQQVIGLQAGQPCYRILIVEDQPENWLLLRRLLQTAGFDVRLAEDGLQAVEAFTAWRPHFIWMDLRLPVLGGLEAATRIRKLDGGREVKIAAVTASAFASQREEVIAAGFDDFLRKPYRSREIFDCMSRHLGVRYVYSAAAHVPAAESAGKLNHEDLAGLPLALQDELENAVISLDRERIRLVIDEISKENAALGRALRPLADKLACTPILQALRTRGSGAKAGAS